MQSVQQLYDVKFAFVSLLRSQLKLYIPKVYVTVASYDGYIAFVRYERSWLNDCFF